MKSNKSKFSPSDDQILRDETIGGFRIITWDCGRAYHGGPQWQVGYRLTDQLGAIVFEGDSFGCSPLHAIDSDACLLGILEFLTMQPGDTDAEYFDNYTDDQLAFASLYAEGIAWEAQCMFGTVECETSDWNE